MATLSKQFIMHVQSPKNIGTLVYASGSAKIGGGGCGDAIEVQLRINGGNIEDIKCLPHGCLNTVVCASAMSELVKGRQIPTALALTPEDVAKALGGLPKHHMHCAGMAVDALRTAIEDYSQRCSYWSENEQWANR
jgi:nitrogen fixation protein NifU and related proteins